MRLCKCNDRIRQLRTVVVEETNARRPQLHARGRERTNQSAAGGGSGKQKPRPIAVLKIIISNSIAIMVPALHSDPSPTQTLLPHPPELAARGETDRSSGCRGPQDSYVSRRPLPRAPGPGPGPGGHPRRLVARSRRDLPGRRLE